MSIMNTLEGSLALEIRVGGGFGIPGNLGGGGGGVDKMSCHKGREWIFSGH